MCVTRIPLLCFGSRCRVEKFSLLNGHQVDLSLWLDLDCALAYYNLRLIAKPFNYSYVTFTGPSPAADQLKLTCGQLGTLNQSWRADNKWNTLNCLSVSLVCLSVCLSLLSAWWVVGHHAWQFGFYRATLKTTSHNDFRVCNCILRIRHMLHTPLLLGLFMRPANADLLSHLQSWFAIVSCLLLACLICFLFSVLAARIYFKYSVEAVKKLLLSL